MGIKIIEFQNVGYCDKRKIITDDWSNTNYSLKEISGIINVDYMGANETINGFNNADCQSLYNSVLTYCLNEIYINKALINIDIITDNK